MLYRQHAIMLSDVTRCFAPDVIGGMQRLGAALAFPLRQGSVKISSMTISAQTSGDVAEHRIGVTVLTGFLGSGKTTLLNRLVRDPAYADAAVIVNEIGNVGVDHHLIRHADGHIALIAGGCICCTVSGSLVNTLRELFMLALRRQIPRFRRVLIETTGLATPAAILFTLRHEHFVVERYVYGGTMTVVDATHIQAQLTAQPEAAQQVAAADIVVCTKVDLVDANALGEAAEAVAQVNPGVPIIMQRLDARLDPRLLVTSLACPDGDRDGLGRWRSGFMSLGSARHPLVRQATLELTVPVTRAVFLTGMARLQEAHHRGLLRIKGVLGFEGESLPCAVHGVHRELYPLERLSDWPAGEHRSWLVLIVRDLDPDALIAELRRAWGQPEPGPVVVEM